MTIDTRTERTGEAVVMGTLQDLDESAVRRTQKDWIASHGGRKLPAVLTGGFKFAPLSIAPNESQFLETSRANVATIARPRSVWSSMTPVRTRSSTQ